MRSALLLAVALAGVPVVARPVAAGESIPLRVAYDAAHLDLDGHCLGFKATGTVASASIVVIGDDGAEIGTGAADYKNGQGGGDWLNVTWTQRPDTHAMILRLRVVAVDGRATNVELIPWSVAIDHEDVNFKTDSAVIEPAEEAKLQASITKIQEVVRRSEKFMKMTLYVAGHTDTVGSADKNRTLSLARARAIAGYFRRKGVAIPIQFAGFGEDVLKVQTPQETDAAANRRADYVIGPTAAPPPFKGPYLKVHVRWQSLR